MAHLSAPQGAPVIVLLGPVGVGKSLLATALAGLQLENSIFRVGDAAHAVTLEATSHRSRWFGRQTEEEFILLDPPGVGDGDCDAARLANVVRIIREWGYVARLYFFQTFSIFQPYFAKNYVLLNFFPCFTGHKSTNACIGQCFPGGPELGAATHWKRTSEPASLV